MEGEYEVGDGAPCRAGKAKRSEKLLSGGRRDSSREWVWRGEGGVIANDFVGFGTCEGRCVVCCLVMSRIDVDVLWLGAAEVRMGDPRETRVSELLVSLHALDVEPLPAAHNSQLRVWAA